MRWALVIYILGYNLNLKNTSRCFLNSCYNFYISLDLENFDKIRIKGEAFYKNLKEIHCPYFKDKVSFSSQGLEHLKFKQRGKARLEQDQYMRFKLIHLAPEVIKVSSSLQGM